MLVRNDGVTVLRLRFDDKAANHFWERFLVAPNEPLVVQRQCTDIANGVDKLDCTVDTDLLPQFVRGLERYEDWLRWRNHARVAAIKGLANILPEELRMAVCDFCFVDRACFVKIQWRNARRACKMATDGGQSEEKTPETAKENKLTWHECIPPMETFQASHAFAFLQPPTFFKEPSARVAPICMSFIEATFSAWRDDHFCSQV